MVSDAAKKKALAKKLNKTAKFQGKDAADAQAASISHSAVRFLSCALLHSVRREQSAVATDTNIPLYPCQVAQAALLGHSIVNVTV